MKSFFFLSVIIGTLTFSCQNKHEDDSLTGGVVNNPLSAENPADPSNLPAIAFERTEFDFGRIYEGEKVRYNFKFTNVGKSDLIITGVRTACGCTVPEYPKTPIKSGQDGIITVEFNSAGRKGQQNKTVTVTTNAQPPTTVLFVRAMIIEL